MATTAGVLRQLPVPGRRGHRRGASPGLRQTRRAGVVHGLDPTVTSRDGKVKGGDQRWRLGRGAETEGRKRARRARPRRARPRRAPPRRAGSRKGAVDIARLDSQAVPQAVQMNRPMAREGKNHHPYPVSSGGILSPFGSTSTRYVPEATGRRGRLTRAHSLAHFPC